MEAVDDAPWTEEVGLAWILRGPVEDVVGTVAEGLHDEDKW